MTKRLLTVKEAAEYLQVKEGTLYQWAWRKSIPFAVKVGALLRFDLVKIEKWLDENRIPMAPGEKIPKGLAHLPR